MNLTSVVKKIMPGLIFLILALVLAVHALAHCDTEKGPVIQDARKALDQNNVTLVLKWVPPEREAEVRQAFQQALQERKKSKSAEKSDRTFFTILVREHRAGERVAFTGLKPDEVEPEPIVQAADKAVELGSDQDLLNMIREAMQQEIHSRFVTVLNKKPQADENVSAGREYVAAYVDYVHYVEKLYDTVITKAGHSAGEPEQHLHHHGQEEKHNH